MKKRPPHGKGVGKSKKEAAMVGWDILAKEDPKRTTDEIHKDWDKLIGKNTNESEEQAWKNWEVLIQELDGSEPTKGKLYWMLLKLRLSDVVQYGMVSYSQKRRNHS